MVKFKESRDATPGITHGNKQRYYRTNGNNGQPIVNKPVPKRNEPCPCGSGKKAKKCCLGKIKFFASLTDEQRNNIIMGRLLRPQVLDTTPQVVSDKFQSVSMDTDVEGHGPTTCMTDTPLRNWDDLSQEEQARILTEDAILQGKEDAHAAVILDGIDGLRDFDNVGDPGVQGPVGIPE